MNKHDIKLSGARPRSDMLCENLDSETEKWKQINQKQKFTLTRILLHNGRKGVMQQRWVEVGPFKYQIAIILFAAQEGISLVSS